MKTTKHIKIENGAKFISLTRGFSKQTCTPKVTVHSLVVQMLVVWVVIQAVKIDIQDLPSILVSSIASTKFTPGSRGTFRGRD